MWAFDAWAAHAYPGNYPPELNIHGDQAVDPQLAIDSYVPELQRLAAWGRPAVPILLSETGYALGQRIDWRYPAITEELRADYMRRAYAGFWQQWGEVMGVAPYQLSDPTGAWGAWNWIEDNNTPHAVYTAVQALDKSHPQADGRLTVRFRVMAGSSEGIFPSDVRASADNTSIAPQYGVAAIMVYDPVKGTPTPTMTPTATASPTPTETLTPTPTPTYGPSPTPTPTLTPTPTPTRTPTPEPTRTFTPSPTFTPTPTFTATPTLTPTPTSTPTSTPTAYVPGTPDAYEPDDVPTYAKPLVAGEAPQQRTFHQPSDVDWLWFEASGGQTYFFYAVGSGGTAPLLDIVPPKALTVLEPRSPQTRLWSQEKGEVSGGEGWAWRAVETGVYRLIVTERNGWGGLAFSYTLALAEADQQLYLPIIMAGERLPERLRISDGSPQMAGAPPSGGSSLAIDPRTGRLYILGEDTLALYDPAAGRTVAQADTGREPGGLVVDEASRRVFVASGEQGTILAYDADTLAPLGRASGFAQPGGLALANGRLFAADTQAGIVRMLDVNDLHEMGRAEVGPGPVAIVALPALQRVFVALTGGREIAILDTATGALVGQTHLGGLGHPQGLVEDRVANKVYVTYLLSPHYRQIAVLDGATGAIERVIPATPAHPLSAVSAIALDAAARRVLVSDDAGILAYDLASQTWNDVPLVRTNGAAPIFGLAVDQQRGTLHTISPAGLHNSLVHHDLEK